MRSSTLCHWISPGTLATLKTRSAFFLLSLSSLFYLFFYFFLRVDCGEATREEDLHRGTPDSAEFTGSHVSTVCFDRLAEKDSNETWFCSLQRRRGLLISHHSAYIDGFVPLTRISVVLQLEWFQENLNLFWGGGSKKNIWLWEIFRAAWIRGNRLMLQGFWRFGGRKFSLCFQRIYNRRATILLSLEYMYLQLFKNLIYFCLSRFK